MIQMLLTPAHHPKSALSPHPKIKELLLLPLMLKVQIILLSFLQPDPRGTSSSLKKNEPYLTSHI
jgi:hypothetical protein